MPLTVEFEAWGQKFLQMPLLLYEKKLPALSIALNAVYLTAENNPSGQEIIKLWQTLQCSINEEKLKIWEENLWGRRICWFIKHLFYCSHQIVIKSALENHWKDISKSSDISSSESVLYYSIKIW